MGSEIDIPILTVYGDGTLLVIWGYMFIYIFDKDRFLNMTTL